MSDDWQTERSFTAELGGVQMAYRVRLFDGVSKKEVTRKEARSTKAAVEQCIQLARRNPGHFALAQSSREDAGGIFSEAYLIRYLRPDEVAAAKATVQSEEDLLVAVMGLVPGPWSGPGSIE